MQQCVDDLADDLDNLSFTSTTTTATTVPEAKRSTSSGSDAAGNTSNLLSTSTKHHHRPPRDPCWRAIQRVKSDNNVLTLADLRFVHRLGSGDIGSVYLVELKGAGGCFFAAKVMDKKELLSRNKESRARIEREVLESLDHPFLPTLYATLDCPRWSSLLTEFCPGGDLHVLRQRQPDRRFHENAVRFYASEVVVALEYLHMMGIIYRDLKPENVLVRSDGHIMLTDFDLSLRSDNSTSTAQLVSDQNASTKDSSSDPTPFGNSSCILPNCIVPAVSCLHPKRKRRKKSMHPRALEIVAEPIDVRSMSFVGTHEYLAPEIVSGEGHGNAVDWWTLGIFIFEMFYGVTPFKGIDHELTLANIVARALDFPKEPTVPAPAKDLIAQLLIKDPARRMGSTMGATPIKHHQFFDGVNWALLRCTTPPYTPRPIAYKDFPATENNSTDNSSISAFNGHYRPNNENVSSFFNFLNESGANLDEVQVRLNTKNYKQTLFRNLQSPSVPKREIIHRTKSKREASSYQLDHHLQNGQQDVTKNWKHFRVPHETKEYKLRSSLTSNPAMPPSKLQNFLPMSVHIQLF